MAETDIRRIERIGAEMTADHSEGGRVIEPVCPVTAKTITLTIKAASDYDNITVGMSTVWNDFGGTLTGTSDAKPADLKNSIARMLEAWERVLFDRGLENAGPRGDRLRLARGKKARHAVWSQLALAGHELYTALFSGGDSDFAAITERLERRLRERTQAIAITSHIAFVPWAMLYLPADPSDSADVARTWRPDGFWGHRHLIEHHIKPSANHTTHIAVTDRISVGAFADDRLDLPPEEQPSRRQPPVVSPVLAKLSESTDVVDRYAKADLEACVRATPFTHHIMYLCGHGGPDGFFLGDGDFVRASEIDYWFRSSRVGLLDSRPMTFANMCGGGRVNPELNREVVTSFMLRGASCVIGPAIEVSHAFAGAYALDFFGTFLRLYNSAGPAMRDLTVQYSGSEFNNPLGLAYALYGGIDVHLCGRDAWAATD